MASRFRTSVGEDVESPEAKKGLEALEKSFFQTEEVWWLAEQNRLCAKLLLLEPRTRTEAETVLRAALEMARSQKSKALELRVTVCLARLLRHQGPLAEGRDLLIKCYGWFTEGFDTADLREAGELLTAVERDIEGASIERNDQ